MKIDDWTSEDVHTVGGGETPPCAGLTPNVLPEAQSTISAVSSHTGVSTRNVHTGTTLKQLKQEDTPHWYALRCTYGREKAAYDYFVAKGIIAFYPTTNAVKIINGKRFVRPPPEPGSRNVDDHKSKAAEPADLFHGFHRFVVPFVHESVLALHRKQNIGYHDDCHHDQPENIQPFHRDTTPRTAASQGYRAGACK